MEEGAGDEEVGGVEDEAVDEGGGEAGEEDMEIAMEGAMVQMLRQQRTE